MRCKSSFMFLKNIFCLGEIWHLFFFEKICLGYFFIGWDVTALHFLKTHYLGLIKNSILFERHFFLGQVHIKAHFFLLHKSHLFGWDTKALFSLKSIFFDEIQELPKGGGSSFRTLEENPYIPSHRASFCPCRTFLKRWKTTSALNSLTVSDLK